MKSMFAPEGVHALVDGQFGSTGKGLFASYLADNAARNGFAFRGVYSNAGPNSGHTFYHEGVKHVLKQLPTFSVKMGLLGFNVPAYLTGGAAIDPDILVAEARRYPNITIYVNPRAVLITPEDKEREKTGTVKSVAGTKSGTGWALARKVLRDPKAVVASVIHTQYWPPNVLFEVPDWDPEQSRYFMEVSQGFSLGIHSEFYPKVTSRECTAAQGLADARLAPADLARTFMTIRTYPIRVGNADGFSSGDCYEDQEEIAWEALGVEPELTTVTQRQRRIFTFSVQQFADAVRANRPDTVLANFMNYIETEDERARFRDLLRAVAPEARYLYGFGPHDTDIVPF